MSFARVLGCLALPFVSLSASALQLPDDLTAEASGPGGAVVHYSAQGSGPDDFNGRPTDQVQCAPASGSLFAIGTTTVSCHDANGAAGSFEVTVHDTTAPMLHLPNGVAAKATSASGAAVSWNAGATDLVDGSVGVTCTPASGSLFAIGTTSVTCTASDARGNVSSGSFDVSVSSAPPPPTPPSDLKAEATVPDGAAVKFPPGHTGSEDGDGRPTANCSPASGSVFPLGKTRVQCDTGSFDVEVVDTTGPKLMLPRDVTASTNDDSGANVTFTASASDLVDGDVAITCAPSSGSLFALGTTEVACESSDTRGNRSDGKFNVTVVKAGPSPHDITAEATGPNGAAVTFTTAGDGADDFNGRPTSGCTPASGSTFPLGATLVQCGGGVAFTVTVVDTTAPALTVPADMTVSEGTTVTYNADAHDLVDGSVAVACAPPSGSVFPAGTTIVTCTASDTRNNSATATFNVTVTEEPPPPPPDDTEAPVIVSIVAAPSVILPPNGKLVDVTLDVHVTDDADSAPLVRIFDVTSNEALDPDDTNQVSPLTVQLRAERDPQGTGRVYTIHVEAIDAAGNRSTASVEVTVPHDASGQSTTMPAPKKQRAVRR